MSTMTNYLRDVAMLEGQLYTQNCLATSLSSKIEPLGYPITYKKPTKSSGIPSFGDLMMFPIMALCGAIPGTLLLWFVRGLLQLFFDIRFDKATASLFETIASAFGVYKDLAIIFMIAGPIIFILSSISSTKKAYEKALQEYHTAVKDDKIRVERELVLRQNLWNQWQNVTQERDKTQAALNTIYSVGIIHPKYRNMVAVSYFYDYFDTGRCFALTGPGGAYATYEEELHFQLIETKLDVIISKLDQLLRSQKMIASLMAEANNTLNRIDRSNDRMIQSMSRIEQNTELIEYNSRCAMQSSVVMEHIMVYNTLKDN